MKNYKVLQNDGQDVIKWEPLSNTAEIGVVSKSAKHLKKIIYLTGLAGILLGFNACVTTGYVATEPTYFENARPPRPSNLHIWINDDWGWNRTNHAYVQKNGYWQKPNQGRTYVSGHWKVTPKGHSWAPGHWQRQGR